MRLRVPLLMCLLLLWIAPAVCRAQRAVLLVRHAEKLDESPDAALAPAGLARAEALSRLLRDAGVGAIYVSERQRTRQTAAPLAQALGLLPVTVPAADDAALLQRLRAPIHRDQVVLVVGHSDTLPKLLRGLGVTRPIAIARAEYDGLYLVTPRTGGPADVLVLRYGR